MANRRNPRLKARVAIADADRLLCVLHAKPDQASFWCLPGGNIDEGETLLDGARRELLEETGATVELDGAILILDSVDLPDFAGTVEVIFRGRISNGNVALGEHSGDPYLAEIAWFPLADLPVNFRPATLRQLLSNGRDLTQLPTVPVGDWAG